MIVAQPEQVVSTSGSATVVEAAAPLAGPPPEFVAIDWEKRVRVVTRDSRGGLSVSAYRAMPALSTQVDSKTAGAPACVPPREAELAAAIQQVELLRELKVSWDGDGAPAPSAAAIRRAIEIVALVRRPPNEVDPDAIGGVALWFYADDGRSTMVGVRNDGRAAICSYARGSAIPDVQIVPDAATAAALTRASLRD